MYFIIIGVLKTENQGLDDDVEIEHLIVLISYHVTGERILAYALPRKSKQNDAKRPENTWGIIPTINPLTSSNASPI